jgi:hypothetical protein
MSRLKTDEEEEMRRMRMVVPILAPMKEKDGSWKIAGYFIQ